MPGNRKRLLRVMWMKEVVWRMALNFPNNMRLFSNYYSGSDRVTSWIKDLSRYHRKWCCLLQHVALYLLKQIPILRAIKLGFGLWLLRFACRCCWWGSGGGRDDRPCIFSGTSWPSTALSNYLLPTYTSSAVPSHFVWKLQSFSPCGFKTLRINVSRLFLWQCLLPEMSVVTLHLGLDWWFWTE